MAKQRKPKGEYVEILDYDPPVIAEVIDLLNSQFTARFQNGTEILTFRFYRDYNDTWRDAEDE